jgi:hypothetical protein
MLVWRLSACVTFGVVLTVGPGVTPWKVTPFPGTVVAAEVTKQAHASTPPRSSSAYRVLYRFDGLDGYPNTRLLRLSVGLYGTTSSAVFRISTHGIEKTLYRFQASSEPFMPAGDLRMA